MRIVVDTREQTPLPFPASCPTVEGTLYSGDYSFIGAEEIFAVERKSIADLVQSTMQGRERFARECMRLRGLRFKRLLIVGTPEDIWEHRYRSKANPKAIMHTLAAFEVRYDLPYVWADTEKKAAGYVERWATFYHREMIEKVAKAIQKGDAE